MSSFELIREDGTEWYVSDIIPCGHRFTTRSSAGHIGGFLTPSRQVHGDRICTVTKADADAMPECDGLITLERGTSVAVRTADCVPILMYAEYNGAKAAAAIHSGWRGTAEDIAGKAVAELVRLGFPAFGIRAAIGACIHECCYEVGEELIGSMKEKLGEDTAMRFIHTCSGRTTADLPGLCRFELERAGVAAENIDVCDECTCCDTSRFYSYRGEGGLKGLMYAVITLD